MSDLKRVIKEELGDILQNVEDVDLEEDRERRDRMTPAEDASTSGRWYSDKEDTDAAEKVRNIVAETYRKLRDTSEVDIEEKTGVQDFEIPERGDRDRWYETEKGREALEEIAKRAFKNLLKEQSVRDLIQNAGNMEDVRDAALEMAEDLGYELAFQDLITALDEPSLRDAVSDIARQRNL